MRRQARLLYEFGPFRLDVTERLLSREGKAVPLSPKVFETLLALVENSGHVLAKEELIKTLWPDSFVEESNLTHYISQLRKTLGDFANGQTYITTVPKHGYRFNVDVKEIRIEADEIAACESNSTLPLPDFGESACASVSVNQDASFIRSNGSDAALKGRQSANQPIENEETKSGSRFDKVAPGRGTLLIGVVSLIAAAGVLGIYFLRKAANPVAPFLNMRITRLITGNISPLAAISPDGKYMAYVQRDGLNQSLWVRQTASPSSVQVIAPSEVHLLNPTFSPDGNHLLYVAYKKGTRIGILYKVAVLGGVLEKIIEDVDSPVAISRDSMQLAFVRKYPDQRESALIVANFDGAEERRIAVRKYPLYFSLEGPSFSPDGKMVACSVGRNEIGNTYVQVIAVQLEDAVEKVIGPQRWPWAGQVAWSGDGSGLFINAWAEESNALSDQIWYLSCTDGKAHRITNDLSRYVKLSASADSNMITTVEEIRFSQLWIVANGRTDLAAPISVGFGDNYSESMGLSWEPDGRLVYGSNASGNTDIWIMDSDGKNQERLTFSPLMDKAPSVSRDGRFTVFVSYRDGIPHIWRMDKTGGDARQLTYGSGEFHPSVSPDGERVVYSTIAEGSHELWRVSIDGGKLSPLGDGSLSRPVFSPDGKLIACYLLDPQSERTKVAVIASDNGMPIKIFDDMELPDWGLLCWSVDGRALTYIVTRNGVSNIWSRSLDGAPPCQLTDFKSDRIFRFAWSADGKKLACERGVTINNIVLISRLK